MLIFNILDLSHNFAEQIFNSINYVGTYYQYGHSRSYYSISSPLD